MEGKKIMLWFTADQRRILNRLQTILVGKSISAIVREALQLLLEHHLNNGVDTKQSA